MNGESKPGAVDENVGRARDSTDRARGEGEGMAAGHSNNARRIRWFHSMARADKDR
jgi:hypothetical protein